MKLKRIFKNTKKSDEAVKAFHETGKRFDPQGVYTGESSHNEQPVQDADDI